MHLLDTLQGLRICHNNSRQRGHITNAEHRTAITTIDRDIRRLRAALGTRDEHLDI